MTAATLLKEQIAQQEQGIVAQENWLLRAKQELEAAQERFTLQRGRLEQMRANRDALKEKLASQNKPKRIISKKAQ